MFLLWSLGHRQRTQEGLHLEDLQRTLWITNENIIMNLPKPYRKKKRFADVLNAGFSSHVPYISNESWQDRHKRRKLFALQHIKELGDWCTKHKWEMEVKNEGHHWMFKCETRIVEWWPSSGKVVIEKKWNKGIHCHDHEQLVKILDSTKRK